MEEDPPVIDRRSLYRVNLPSLSPYRLELETYEGETAQAKLIDCSIAGMRARLPRGVTLPCQRGEVLEARIKLNSLPSPLEFEVAVATVELNVNGETHLGLRLGDRKLLERQLPKRYYPLFNRRRSGRISPSYFDGETALELHTPPTRVLNRSAVARLQDISRDGLRAEADANFDDVLGRDRRLLTSVQLPRFEMPLNIPARVRTRSRGRFRVQYGLMFDPVRGRPDPRDTIEDFLRGSLADPLTAAFA